MKRCSLFTVRTTAGMPLRVFLGALVLLGASQQAQAQSQPAMDQTEDATDKAITKALSASQRNTMLLRSKIDETKAQVDLQTLQDTLNAGAKAVSAEKIAGAKGDDGKADAQARKTDAAPVPAVSAIFGVDKTLYATLRYRNGVRMDVRAGDEIEGGFKIRAITANQVLLGRGAETFPLRIYAGNSTFSDPQPSRGVGPMMGNMPGGSDPTQRQLPRLFSDESQVTPTSSFTPGVPPGAAPAAPPTAP